MFWKGLTPRVDDAAGASRVPRPALFSRASGRGFRFAAVCMVWATSALGGNSEGPATPKERASYAAGVELARSVNRQGLDLDVEVLLQGMRDALTGQPLAMTQEEILRTMASLRQEQKQKQLQTLGTRRRGTAPPPQPEDK